MSDLRTGRREPAMGFILLTVLIDMMAVGLIVPVLPALVGTFTANTTEQTFWFGAVALASRWPTTRTIRKTRNRFLTPWTRSKIPSVFSRRW